MFEIMWPVCSCGWKGHAVQDYNSLQLHMVKEQVQEHLHECTPKPIELTDKVQIAAIHLQYSVDRDKTNIVDFIQRIQDGIKFGLPLIHVMVYESDGDQMRNCARYLLTVAKTIHQDEVSKCLASDDWFPMGQLYDDSRSLLAIALNNNHQLS